MLEKDVMEVLRQRRFLFRGTNNIYFESSKTPNGFYCGIQNGGRGQTTSATLSVNYAILNAICRMQSDFALRNAGSARPVLLAIDSLPYLSRIEKGLEWAAFRILDDGRIVHDEYIIKGLIDLKHIEAVDNTERLRFYSSGISEEAFSKMKSYWLANFK